MNTITIRHLLSGDLLSIPYDTEVPSVPSIRKEIYDHYVGEHGRNEIITIFDKDGKIVTDDEKLEQFELSAFVDREKKMKPSENANVVHDLRMFIEKRNDCSFEKFQLLIMECKAFIAGGSILASFGNFEIHDLDIYVNYSNALKLLDELVHFGFIQRGQIQEASKYDDSFFRKNNIKARFYLQRSRYGRYDDDNNEAVFFQSFTSQTIDVMLIPDDYDLEKVVTNFDLSFCEIWWDGKDTYASDPYGVRHKTGMLKPDYRRSLFMEMNHFITARIKKYLKRGFTVDNGLIEFLREYPDHTGVYTGYDEIPSKTYKIYRKIKNTRHWVMSNVKFYLRREFQIILRRIARRRGYHLHHIYFIVENFQDKMNEEQIKQFIRFFFRDSYLAYTNDENLKEIFVTEFAEYMQNYEEDVNYQKYYISGRTDTLRKEDFRLHLLPILIDLIQNYMSLSFTMDELNIE